MIAGSPALDETDLRTSSTVDHPLLPTPTFSRCSPVRPTAVAALPSVVHVVEQSHREPRRKSFDCRRRGGDFCRLMSDRTVRGGNLPTDERRILRPVVDPDAAAASAVDVRFRLETDNQTRSDLLAGPSHRLRRAAVAESRRPRRATRRIAVDVAAIEGRTSVEQTEAQPGAAGQSIEHVDSSVANGVQRTDPMVVFPVGERTPRVVCRPICDVVVFGRRGVSGEFRTVETGTDS
jgi:hypothetical protein